MNYSVIKQGHFEGLVVTADGGVASFYEQDGLFNLCLYQTHVLGFSDSDKDWDELLEGKMYVQLHTKEYLELFEMNIVDALTNIALRWLCVSCDSFQEVEFSKLWTMRKTEFFKKYGHLLVNVFDEHYNDDEYDRNEGGDYLLWDDDIAQDYDVRGYNVCTIYEEECEDCEEIVSMEFDLSNNPMKVGYLVLNKTN